MNEREAIKQEFRKVYQRSDDMVAEQAVTLVFKQMFPSWSDQDLRCLLDAAPYDKACGSLDFCELIDWMWAMADIEHISARSLEEYITLIGNMSAEELSDTLLSLHPKQRYQLKKMALAFAARNRGLEELARTAQRLSDSRTRARKPDMELADLFANERDAESFRVQAVEALLLANGNGILDQLLQNTSVAEGSNSDFNPPQRSSKVGNVMEEQVDNLQSLMLLEDAAETFRAEAVDALLRANEDGRLDDFMGRYINKDPANTSQ